VTDLRTLESDSIRAFIQSAADEGYLHSIVLDYGCGKQPYRDIVESVLPLGGVYQPFDQARFPANVSGKNIGEGNPLIMDGWGTILCTQVAQYVPHYHEGQRNPFRGLLALLADFEIALRKGGYLVMTYPTNWPEVEPEDLHRFTKAGMTRLLTEAGFEIVRHERRSEMIATVEGSANFDRLAVGYGVIARA
jgi:hypothetical protein